ncbi:hypothetical protein LCGC14_2471940 [marine sediment metagenome]|uniref:Uncharacterized protein n=1 Tax=marine sediment metagenome TaxID=412755 RepID=A0A0F9BXY8_9ZZZZ
MEIHGITLQGPWGAEEVSTLFKTLKPLPSAWLEKNPYVQAIIRGDALKGAPADAPGHSKYDSKQRAIVVYDKGVYHAGSSRIDKEQLSRSVLHELAHTLLRQFGWLNEWKQETKNDGFVDEYARTASQEDFADTFSEFFIKPNRTARVAPKKFAFIQDRLARAQEEKIAMANIESFADELGKVANLGGMLGRIGKMPRGLKLGLGAAGGAGLYSHGKTKGRKTGRAEGTRATRVVAERAYKMGVTRGAMAMRQHIVTRMRAAMGRRQQ